MKKDRSIAALAGAGRHREWSLLRVRSAGSRILRGQGRGFLAGSGGVGDIEVDVMPPEPRGAPPNSPQSVH
jgi:hypothetical protein